MNQSRAERAAEPDADGSLPSEPENLFGEGLSRMVVRNTAAQMSGRILAALCRLLITALIVRGLGRTVFAEYVLVFGILAIAEWILDFGTTEVFVRDLCRDPRSWKRLIRILTATRFVQIPIAAAILMGILGALRYPAHVLEAGLIGGVSLLFFAFVLVYHVMFKATLSMQRGVAAELISVVVLIPMVMAVAHYRLGLIGLFASHVLSRAIFLLFCQVFAARTSSLSVEGVSFAEIQWALRSSAAIGAIGLLVSTYENIDLILMSKLASSSDLAYYAGAQKFVWPVLMALSAVGATLYPLTASYWPDSPGLFGEASQRALDSVIALAGLVVAVGFTGAGFLMGLLGPAMVQGAPALQILILICFAKAITWTVGPILYVLNAQNSVLHLIAIALLIRVLTTASVAARFGYAGVACGAVIVEICFLTIPALVLVQRRTGYRWRWVSALKIVAITAVSIAVPWLVLSLRGLPAAMMAGSLYIPLVFATGAARWSELRSILKWEAP